MAVYDPRGGGGVHVDKVLTNVSLAFPNNGLVGNALFQEVMVNKPSDLYNEFGREAWFPEDDVRAPGTTATEIPGLKISQNPYFCRERALQIAVTPEERQNADSPLDPDRDGTELVTSKILLKREQRIKDFAVTTANYAAGHSVTLAGANQWSDYVGSSPIVDVKAGMRQVHSALFMEPNLGIFPYEVMTQLEDHPDFIERIKYSQAGILTADIIASVLGLQQIIVPGLGYNSATNPGQTLTLSYLWGKDVVLAWVAPKAGLKRPAYGYEFVQRFARKQQRVVRWWSNDREADIIRVKRNYDLKPIAVDGSGLSIAGYVIKAAVA